MSTAKEGQHFSANYHIQISRHSSLPIGGVSKTPSEQKEKSEAIFRRRLEIRIACTRRRVSLIVTVIYESEDITGTVFILIIIAALELRRKVSNMPPEEIQKAAKFLRQGYCDFGRF